MIYKKSNYNIFCNYYTDNNFMIAYNSFTNALGLIKKDELNCFSLYPVCKENLDDDLLDNLIEGGFLIKDDCNELDILKYQMHKSRFNQNTLSLTISPFSGCNFRCVYCFEGDRLDQGIKMTDEIQDSIIKYVKESADSIDYLDIVWFGGEPTLAIDVIQTLSDSIIKICDNENIEYSASIVTNGYLINDDIADAFRKCRINSMQITLDGKKETHDARRIQKNGNGSFDVIINNIINYAEKLPSIKLRINIDKSNNGAEQELTEYFREKGILDKLYISIGKVYSDETNEYSDRICYTDREFAFKLLDYKLANGESIQLPSSLTNACTSVNENCFVIDADGFLYKCWNEIGDKKYSFGHIKDGFNLRGIALDYINYDVTKEKECKKCNLLPICMGGCNSLKRKELDCCEAKHTLEQQLNLIINNLENN